ncbi:GAF domain-containing protein [Streptomyces sp. RFCAC02]|uniref:GAF domain-containing protein n=1 Tax=Streptomyces sp. RFCAC02 TaxID=2499143 RepID=UPI00102055EA|nr:GAF domain-containing protein [Streptomyces sp. RFCAC02]
MTALPPDPTGRLLLTPDDPDAPARAARLRELGIGAESRPEFDTVARDLARLTGTPLAMVNLVGERRQFFAGLYAAPGTGKCRTMARDHGFCPHVVARRRALALDDVTHYPRFAGNPLVDEAGIRAYLGAPLLDGEGMALGTLCVMDHLPRSWGRAGVGAIKAAADEVAGRLLARPRGTGEVR